MLKRLLGWLWYATDSVGDCWCLVLPDGKIVFMFEQERDLDETVGCGVNPQLIKSHGYIHRDRRLDGLRTKIRNAMVRSGLHQLWIGLC